MRQQLRNYLEALVIETPAEWEVINKLWNSKLELGLETMLLEDTCAYSGQEYNLSPEQVSASKYASETCRRVKRRIWTTSIVSKGLDNMIDHLRK